MSSWRSRFRKTKTPESHEIKTTSNFSKTSDDVDQPKKRRSRFLRRSKHEDEFDRPRPRSLYIERNTLDVDNGGDLTISSRNLANPPSVQEILDRNRRDRGSSKSPRPWRKFLAGDKLDRSPGGSRRTEMNSGNEENFNSYRNRDNNHNYESKYGSSGGSYKKSYGYDGDGKYSPYGIDYAKDSKPNREMEGGRREHSSRKMVEEISSNRDRVSAKSDSDKSAGSARSASPYDNVEEATWKDSLKANRGERPSRSEYMVGRTGSTRDSETSSVIDKPITPQMRRKGRMQRTDSHETVNSEKSSKDSFIATKSRSVYSEGSYRNDLKDQNDVTRKDSSYQNESMRSLNSPRIARKLSSGRESLAGYETDRSTRSGERIKRGSEKGGGYETDRSMRGGEKMNRSYERGGGYETDRSIRGRERVNRSLETGGYGRRSSENILGATLNYIERRVSVDSSHSNTSPYETENDNSRAWRRRIKGLQGLKSMDSILISESGSERNDYRRTPTDNSEDSGRRRPSTSSYRQQYDTGANKSSFTSTNRRERDTTTRQRPKSLYDYRETIDFTDTVTKFKQGSQNESNYENTYSVWERYKPRSIYPETETYSRRVTDDEKEAKESSWRRPKTLFMAENDKKESAYRGNWSVNVPKQPAHLRDFSRPDETASSYSWRRKKKESDGGNSEREAAKEKREEKVRYQRKEIQQQQQQQQTVVTRHEDQSNSTVPAIEFTVSEPNEENKQKTRSGDSGLQSPNPTSNIAVIEEENLNDKNKLTLGEDTVVRRRKKEHAPPARPSSFYFVKGDDDDSLEDVLAPRREKQTYDFEDDDLISRKTNINLDSEDIKAGLRKKSAVERRLRNKSTKERPKSVHLADIYAVSDADHKKSSYLPSRIVHDPLRDTVDEVKKEFEKLLRRTSDWTLRTESLSSKATYLSSSYRGINKALTGIRDESDTVCAVFDDIGERLTVSESVGYPDTEDEWRRAFEGSKLLAKATKLLEYQKRNPKPDFEYSDSEDEPETPGKPYYDMPQGIPWFTSNTSRYGSRMSSSSEISLYASKSADDFVDGNRKSYMSYRPSLEITSSLSVSSSSRYSSSFIPDTYSRRKRLQDTLADIRRSSSSLSNSSMAGRMIPETAV